jgi:hypothetical protein
MRQMHERLPIHEDAPTPEQLHRLAGRCVLLGRQAERFRQLPNTPERSHFMTAPPTIVVPGLDEAPAGFSYEHRLAARVERTDFRTWSMRLLATHLVSEQGVGRASDRHTYAFEWNSERAIMAERRIDIVPSVETPELIDMVDQGVAVPSEMAALWDLETQLRQVTAGDVELLTREVERHQGGVQYGNGFLSAA